MAGFAIIYEPDSSADERENDFSKLLQLTAHYKFLELPLNQVLGRNCTAAKLNSASSIHNFIARDEKTGSWLLAAGTVVALDGNNDPLKQLDILLKNYL